MGPRASRGFLDRKMCGLEWRWQERVSQERVFSLLEEKGKGLDGMRWERGKTGEEGGGEHYEHFGSWMFGLHQGMGGVG